MSSLADRRSSKFRVCVRCAQETNRAATLTRFGASGRYLSRHVASVAGATHDSAVQNFEYVWRKPAGLTRYSDGSYCVLYTATTERVAEVERCHWLVELVFKKSNIEKSDKGFFIYSCQVKGPSGSKMWHWKTKNKKLVHPNDYAYCHDVAKYAIEKNLSYLLVPSARKFGGVCTPVFNKNSASVGMVLRKFDVFWDKATQKAFIRTGGRRRYVTSDRVYEMLK